MKFQLLCSCSVSRLTKRTKEFNLICISYLNIIYTLLLLVSFCLSSHLKSSFSLLSFYPLQQETTLCSCKDGSSSSLTISIEVSSSLAKVMLVTTCFISAISISSLYILLFFKSFSFHENVGHYVPQLAELMIQYNQKHHLFNLRGIAVSFKTPFHPPLIISITMCFFFLFVL